MSLDYPVPFFGNTPDDTHCFQASLKMVLKYFKPKTDFTWEELDELTAKDPGRWTWNYAAVIWLADHDFELVNIDPFDNQAFIKDGREYLVKEFGEEVAQAQDTHSDLEHERRLAKTFLERAAVELRVPTQQDLIRLLNDGYLIICGVNSHVLNKHEGYEGHAIVIKGLTDTGFLIHNPGLPPKENQAVDFDLFEKAWSYPNEKAKNILAIKLEAW